MCGGGREEGGKRGRGGGGDQHTRMLVPHWGDRTPRHPGPQRPDGRKPKNASKLQQNTPQTCSTEMSTKESEAHPAKRAAGTCCCMNTATSTTTSCTCGRCNCTTGTSPPMYGNWENLNGQLDSLDHRKSLCATTGKSTTLKMSGNCGTSRRYALSGPRHLSKSP